jgi:hypothetical protein
LLEGVDVHPQLASGTKHQQVAFGGQVEPARRGVEGLADGVDGVAEVVRGGLLAKLWPEQVHHLLPLETVAGSQGEHLDKRGGLPQAPDISADGPRTHGYPKAAEQPDAHWLRARIPTLARRLDGV